MSNHDESPRSGEAYTAPEIEQLIEADQITREVHYAGVTTTEETPG